MSKTVRVEIETDDGKIAILTGEAADVWQSQIDHAGSMASAHGSQFVRLPWVETTRAEENVKNNPFLGLYDAMRGRITSLQEEMNRMQDRFNSMSQAFTSLTGNLKGMIMCSEERDAAMLAIEVAVATPIGGDTVHLKGGSLSKDEVASILREHGVGDPNKGSTAT